MSSPSITFTVPLSWEAHSLAQHYRLQQTKSHQAKHVYLNTLAVFAGDFYLRCLGITTDLAASQSRNPVSLHFLNIADLVIPHLGILECRPVLPNADVLEIPTEVRDDRIGYLAIQLDQSLKKAEILGFTQKSIAQISLTDLKSLDDFCIYLTDLRQAKVCEQLTPFHPGSMVELSKWLEGVVSAGWQSLDALLPSSVLAAVRSPSGSTDQQGSQPDPLLNRLRKAKLIDLGLQLGDQTIMLVLNLTPSQDQTMSALVQVYPAYDKYLPAQLQLKMLSEAGDVLQEVWSRGKDNFIQLKQFSGHKGDRFRLQVAIDEICITENFVF